MLEEVKDYLEKSINEEQEAIDAYTQRIESIDGFIQECEDEELAEKLTQVSDKIEHIKQEEQEHLQELNELMSLMGFETIETFDFSKFLVPDPRKTILK